LNDKGDYMDDNNELILKKTAIMNFAYGTGIKDIDYKKILNEPAKKFIIIGSNKKNFQDINFLMVI